MTQLTLDSQREGRPMTDMFKGLAERIVSGPGVLMAFGVFLVLFIIGVGTGIEDYTTNLVGYLAIPTRKYNEWAPYLVALAPQVLQIAMLFYYAHDTARRWALLTAYGAWLIDVAFDVVAKAGGKGAEIWLVAFFESAIVYSIFSEIAFTIGLGMMLELFPHFLRELENLFRHTTKGGQDE